ncbi:SixA phosphatase family protein [Echinicola rosea]|nr:histidine phosphatase family protein [Echinicola rosea]
MTKVLTLLRHGESEVGLGQKEDFSRKLTSTGKLKLERLTNVLATRSLEYSAVVSSTATRTRKTTEIVIKAIQVKECTFLDALYLADVQTIVDLCGNLPNECSKVMIVGHNPGLSAFLSFLTGEYQPSLQPGMMAMIDFDVDAWEVAITRGMGNLVEILQ